MEVAEALVQHACDVNARTKVELGGVGWSWMELGGVRWSWVELDGVGWSWVELGGRGGVG